MLKPDACIGCALYERGTSFSIPDGLGTLGVVGIGEALGHEEAIENKPFRPHAQAGSMLNRILRLMGLSRDHFYLWNIIACQPPDNRLLGAEYERDAISHCKTHFDRVVGGFKTAHTKTLLGFGNIPLRALSGFTGVAKQKESISMLRGYVYTTRYGPMVLTYHPSFLQRGQAKLTPTVMYDIRKAINIANGTYTNYLGGPGYREPNYQIAPTTDEARSVYYKAKDNPRLALGLDIETPWSRDNDEEEKELDPTTDITQFQVSLGKGHGLAMPYEGPFIKIIDDFLKLPNPKMGWNWWEFDGPRLEAKGHRIVEPVTDLMYMFKHWHPALERNLQKAAGIFGFPFPWKHLFNKSLGWYGCADVESLHYISAGLIPMMKHQGIWDGPGGFVNHVYQLRQAMVKAENRGIPVNEKKRVALDIDFKGRRKEKDGQLQESVPLACRNITPRRKDKETGQITYGYKRVPKQVKEALSRYQILKEQNPTRKMVAFPDYLYKLHQLQLRKFPDELEDGVPAVRFVKVKPFKGSNQQLRNYLAYKRKELTAAGKHKEAKLYKTPTTSKGKETTAGKELEIMFETTGDTVLELVTRVRSLDTNINNYIPNWKPHADGYVHPTFNYLPYTGQLASRGPNVQNCSKHTEFGQEFRNIIEASADHVFLEFDKRRFHIATMGYCANDASYIRFGELDCHSIFTSYVMGDPIDMTAPEGEIKERVAYIKKKYKDERDKKFKHVVLGNQLGLGSHKLWVQHRRDIANQAEAQRLQDFLAELFPKPTIFKTQIRDKAFSETFLKNEWGRIAYFFEVYRMQFNKRSGQWQQRHGKDSESCIAFPVQSIAFGEMFWNLLELERLGYNERYRFIDTIHDSYIFLVHRSKVESCIADVYPILSRPCTVLKKECCPEGLQVGVDVSKGRNWRYFDKTHNPDGMEEMKI